MSSGQKKNIFQDWTELIFPDECVFQLGKTTKKTKIYTHRENGQDGIRKNAIKLPQTEVQILGSITAWWGCLSCWGFGCLEPLQGNMDSSHYVEKTLPNVLIPSIEMMYPFGERLDFQHDNALPHTAQISKIWPQQKSVQTID